MDWKSLIAELGQFGYTQPRIATECRCSQSTISDLANGTTKEPRHSLGESLKRLHKRAKAKAERAGSQ